MVNIEQHWVGGFAEDLITNLFRPFTNTKIQLLLGAKALCPASLMRMMMMNLTGRQGRTSWRYNVGLTA